LGLNAFFYSRCFAFISILRQKIINFQVGCVFVQVIDPTHSIHLQTKANIFLGLLIKVMNFNYLFLNFLLFNLFFELKKKVGFPSFLDYIGDERIARFYKLVVDLNVKLFYLARCNTLKQINNLLFHLIVIHYKHVLASSTLSSSLYHIERYLIADSDHVGCRNILAFHLFDHLNDFLGIKDLAICKNNNVSLILFAHDFFCLNNV
jgi:hypothetical protein